MYDPEKPADVLSIPEPIMHMLRAGIVLDAHSHADLRKQLTAECVCCGSRYQRPQDLRLHLQSAHSALWKQAQATLKMFTARKFLGPKGCVRIPSRKVHTL